LSSAQGFKAVNQGARAAVDIDGCGCLFVAYDLALQLTKVQLRLPTPVMHTHNQESLDIQTFFADNAHAKKE
jgi:hypothetical protein